MSLIDLQLPDDAMQLGVARFDPLDGRGKIGRWRRMRGGGLDLREQRSMRGVEWVAAAARFLSHCGGGDADRAPLVIGMRCLALDQTVECGQIGAGRATQTAN